MNVQIGDKLQNVNQMLSAQIESIWAEKRQTVRLLGGLTIDTPEGNSRRSWSGPRRASGPRGTAGGTRATGAQPVADPAVRITPGQPSSGPRRYSSARRLPSPADLNGPRAGIPGSSAADQPLLRRNERRLAAGPCEPCTLPVWSAPSVVACVLRLRS